VSVQRATGQRAIQRRFRILAAARAQVARVHAGPEPIVQAVSRGIRAIRRAMPAKRRFSCAMPPKVTNPAPGIESRSRSAESSPVSGDGPSARARGCEPSALFLAHQLRHERDRHRLVPPKIHKRRTSSDSIITRTAIGNSISSAAPSANVVRIIPPACMRSEIRIGSVTAFR